MRYVFQVKVPVLDNDGRNTIANRKEFEQRIFTLTGGFDVVQKDGAWRDDDGRDYREQTLVYDIAFDLGRYQAIAIERTIHTLREIAKECYPDQKAIFIGEIGRATIE
jgi:hypothetical protein